LPVTLISIVRNVDASVEGQQLSRSSNIENCITFFEVKLNMATRVLTVSLAEHSILENSNFKLPVEQSIRLSLPESLFGPKQWTHLAIGSKIFHDGLSAIILNF
jgi:hypothetical protein